MTLRVSPPNLVEKSNLTVDDSDKTLTVPANTLWRVQFVYVKLISTSTVGNRQMRLEIGDGTNLLWFKNFGAVQAASLTRHYYAAADYTSDEGSFDSGGRIRLRLDAHWLLPGFTLRAYDSAAIAAAADDMELYVVVDEQRKPAPA